MKYLKELKSKLFADIMEVPAVLQGSYYPALDGLRGVAILMVVLAHFGINHILRPYHLLINSDTGVNIFFVLSGFLITTLLLKEKLKSGKISLKRFYIRRILRILPAAYLFLIVMIALNYFLQLHIPALEFIASFLFIKNLPVLNEPYTAHFWTLAVEVQFYLIFPFILASNTNRFIVIAVAIVIIVPVIAVLGFHHEGFLYSSPATSYITKIMMYAFWKGPIIILVGSLFAVFLFKGLIRVDQIKSNYFLSFILIMMAIVISSKSFLFYSKYISEYLSAILIGWVILLSLTPGNLLSVVLSNRVLVYTGIISYSVYIWQELFIGIGTWEPWMRVFQGNSIGILILIKLVSVSIIAMVSYYFVELKFLKVKNRFE